MPTELPLEADKLLPPEETPYSVESKKEKALKEVKTNFAGFELFAASVCIFIFAL
jgi:hypothetical protein